MPVFAGGGYLFFRDGCQNGNEFRPVFYEELDLLGMEKFFSYERGSSPLLWASRYNYYYDNGLLFSVKFNGENFEVKFRRKDVPALLEGINLDLLVQMNKFRVEKISDEAQRFLRSVYDEYKNLRKFVCVYSGGKDSEVVLNLMRNVFKEDEYITVFSNTQNENAFTYDVVFEKKKFMKNFYIANVGVSAVEVWRRRKPPTIWHRWCCSFLKEQPLFSFLRKKFGNFDVAMVSGVRRAESSRRAQYTHVGWHKRYKKVLCVCPILDWSSLDVWVYIFMHNLTINKAYRYGFSRIGCRVCPYTSRWSDHIDKKIFFENAYRKLLRELAIEKGVDDVEKFVYEEWKTYDWYKNKCAD